MNQYTNTINFPPTSNTLIHNKSLRSMILFFSTPRFPGVNWGMTGQIEESLLSQPFWFYHDIFSILIHVIEIIE